MNAASDVTIRTEALAPSTAQLLDVLSRTLDRNRRIVDIERAPCAYGSSWWLEEITLYLNDGSRAELVFKDFGRDAIGSGARRIKPAFVTDPTREPWVYRTLLPDAPPGSPKLWDALTDFTARRHWLFLERVLGAPLVQVGDREAWCAAARWLGHFHASTPVPHERGPLLRHDREYHQRWLARALSAAQDGVAHEKLARLRALVPAHERAIDEALATEPSLIHGEFYASNVLVYRRAVHPVDWEMAALGPPLLDLAALMTGRWGADDRIAMMMAYCEGTRARTRRSLKDLMRGVAACQLLLAVQWLGWATAWTAPADHRKDWLEEAERCAEELKR